MIVPVSALDTYTTPPVFDSSAPAEGTPGGQLTEHEIQARLVKTAPRAGSVQVTSSCKVDSTYNGNRDRGEVTSGINRKNTTDTLLFSVSRTVSNGVDASLKYATKADVEAVVGYKLNWSETKTFGYNAQVRPGKTSHIGYKDLYHVSKLKCTQTTKPWLGNSIYPDVKTEYADSWAEQWYSHNFYSWET